MKWRRIEGVMAIGAYRFLSIHLVLRALIGPAILCRAEQNRSRKCDQDLYLEFFYRVFTASPQILPLRCGNILFR